MESTNLGRPRDERIDQAVLFATLEELAEVSYADLTFKAVAVRAGTSVPAIRRRWPSKAHLVHQAVFPENVAFPSRRPDSTVRDELEVTVETCAAMMSFPSVVRAMTGLFSEIAGDAELREELTDRLRTPAWKDIRERFAAAAAREGFELDVDVDTLIESAFGGALMGAMLRGPGGLDQAWCAGMTDLLLVGIYPKQ